MGKNLLNYVGVLDGGDDPVYPTAGRADLDVEAGPPLPARRPQELGRTPRRVIDARPRRNGAALVHLQDCERGSVVRLCLDLAHQLAVNDLIVLIDHDHGTGRETGELATGDQHTVGFQELATAQCR